MFWLILIIVVGLSYIFYRYTAVANKKIFFTSPLFISVIGSLAVLLLAIAVVNVADIQPSSDSSEIVTDSVRLEAVDTSANSIISRGPVFSYRIIAKLHKELKYGELLALKATYSRLSESEDESVASLGSFGLGLIALRDENVALARNHFGNVKNKDLPGLHFCFAELLIQADKKDDAALEYEKELMIGEGNRLDAFLSLVHLYEENKNYDKLRVLLDSDLAEMHFPEPLARAVLLRVHDYLNYWVWIWKMFTNRIHVVGFIAAFLISAMWLIYLSYLDIFKPERFIWFVAMFVGGMFFCPGVFLIVDAIKLISTWSMNGEFFNDLFYCIFMIGVPEEFVKVIPLLILASFSKNLKEPVDYIVYGAASALGFAFMENLLYFAEIKNGIIHGRAYLSVIGHMTFTSIVAYAFVVSKYKLRNKSMLWYRLPIGFFLAATVHGVYDLLIFHDMVFWFFIFFILIVQYWIMMINNAMNNSTHFSYGTAVRAESSRFFITLALTGVFALEYVYAGFSAGAAIGNGQLLLNVGFAGFLIIFFSSNLASYDLIKGYWRNMSVFSKERRGYGNRQQVGPWLSWYFVNASRAHNYVGVHVKISHEKYNHILADYFDGEYEGRIVSRIVLHDGNTPDPNWFLVRMKTPVPLPNDRQDYILARLRYQEDSLLYEDYVEIFFKGIPDMDLLRKERHQKDDFPFYGWAIMRFDSMNK
jgi:RsiW-degrading membrane proteinase PrsW (M82 family)